MEEVSKAAISMAELTRVFGRIGLLSFGGPAAQIALMHRELVDAKAWLTEAEFLRAVSFCMLLPGPEAMQVATYAGWKLRGVPGGLVAGVLFVLPGALVILCLALLYLEYGQLPGVQAAFLGIKAAVVVIVAEAIARLGRRTLKGLEPALLAFAAFAALAFAALPFPLIIGAAALWGGLRGSEAPATAAPLPDMGRAWRPVILGGALWAAPIVVAGLLGAVFFVELGLFFSKLAVVSFGGAYAVLAYMTQEVVTGQGWLTTGQMIDALGLAETTPGPLILVTQFVGHVAGAAHGASVGAGLMVLWVTFVPCFIWIFAGAPLIDWLEGQPRLSGALSAITAAVLGVIASLSLWFALNVLFGKVTRLSFGPMSLLWPEFSTLDLRSMVLICLAALVIAVLRVPLIAALALMAGAGVLIG